MTKEENNKQNKKKKEQTKQNFKQKIDAAILKEELRLEKEKVLRLKADMVNYKRRMDEETNQRLKYASEDIIEELLSVKDNFERAIQLDDNDLTDEVSKFLEGFKMIYGNLINILNNNEVKEIEAEGLEFNPNIHQAVITEKDKTKPGGVILEVLQKGYIYKEKVIRPAMVKVNE